MRPLVVKIAASTVFVGAVCLTGLAVIRYIFDNPDVIGPVALMIGMTPLIVFFEYSPPVPIFVFFIGAGAAIGAIGLLLAMPPHPATWRTAVVSLIAGVFAVVLSVIVCMAATIYYNVGFAGQPPAGWIAWVRVGAGVSDVGCLLVIAGLLLCGASFLHEYRQF
jgi:hypothetical protein